MEIVSGGCNAGASGIGAGLGICCAHAGKSVQIKEPKTNARNLLPIEIIVKNVVDASLHLQQIAKHNGTNQKIDEEFKLNALLSFLHTN
jgi:hypothetical protein